MTENAAEKPSRFVMLDVPVITQQEINWCGIAGTAMLMGYWGTEISQQTLFEHIHGKPYVKKEEQADQSPGPSIGTLGLTIKHFMPDFTTSTIKRSDYERLQEAAGLSPLDILSRLILKKYPVMVRFPKHFVVVKGVNLDRGDYYVNDPYYQVRKKFSRSAFDEEWGNIEEDYPDVPTDHLLLTMYPKRK